MLAKQPKPPNRPAVRRAWADERSAARRARSAGDAAAEVRYLERAHVLGQPFPILHIRTHLSMAVCGIRRRDRREVTGQLVRVLVAGPGSAARRYPLGNTGRADVGATVPMPVPADLRAVLGLDQGAS